MKIVRPISQRFVAFCLSVLMIFGVLSTGITNASAAETTLTGGALALVTESYVDASDGKNIAKDVSYSVTHEERSPQKITDYSYVDYTERVERIYSHRDLNYIYGYPDNTVKPDQSMTRGEAAAVFCRLYDSIYPSMPYRMSATTFSDLTTSAWYYREVEILYNTGVIKDEFGDGKFRGEEPITRAEFATWAARWANLEYATGLSFTDVPVGHWAYGDINAASAAGWIDGYPNGTFQPEASISRVEVMKLVNGGVNRSITLQELTAMGVRNPYTDLATNHWGYTQIMEATVQHSGADWHGTNYNGGKFNVIVEKFVDGEGKELATSVTSSGKAEATTQEISGYEYVGYIRHITYIYNNGTAAPTITKAANVKESYVGGEIRYTITVTNRSTANAAWTNVVLTDDLPQYLQMVDGSVYVNDKNVSYTLTDGVVSIPVGDIASGETVTVVFKATVLPGAEGQTIKNTVVAKGDNGTVQDDVYTATDEGVYINQGQIKPSVEKKSNVSSASVGDRVSYTITASNSADATYKIVSVVAIVKVSPLSSQKHI